MSRAKTLLVIVLLFSYGAVGARQPAVRGDVRLPVPAQSIAAALGLSVANRSTLLLDITRLVYGTDDVNSPRVRELRTALRTALWNRKDKAGETVPLPLDPSIWRDTLLQQQIADKDMVAAITGDRRASLMYHGLSALDDETLAWLGPDRETLLQLREHPGTFAVFGRAVRVRAGRVLVPGGDAAEPLWESLVGASPSRPSAFVQRLFRDDRTAFFYDSVAHLDPARQRFALGLHLPESSRRDRFVALADVFDRSSPDWRPEIRPFVRPLLDPELVLATIAVNESGAARGPMSRRFWDRVLDGDEKLDVAFSPIEARDVAASDAQPPSDAAGLVARVSRVPYTIGRRRLDTILFAQRVFPDGKSDDPGIATAVRGALAFPALMLTLERIGITDPATLAAAARHAAALGDLASEPLRRASLLEFQGALGIVERITRTGLFDAETSRTASSSLLKLELSPDRGYDGRMARWLRGTLARLLPAAASKATDPIEEAILGAMAGVGASEGDAPLVEWEGGRYRVDPAAAELARLRRVRHEQGGAPLDAALDGAIAAETDGAADRGAADRGAADRAATEASLAAGQALGDTLASIVYAAHLGDPTGPGVRSGNVALRHDLGLQDATSGTAWRLPAEDFSRGEGWRVRGSLLGLDAALGRLALRRIDPTAMPQEPKIPAHPRVALSVTAALLSPLAMTDRARDEIAATLGRGRARVASLTGDEAGLDRVAREAGLSEWRRTALAWTVEHDPEALADSFSLLELYWLGAPRGAARPALDAWGASMLPLTGCLCLAMPEPRPWEDFAGRRTSGIMAARGADVALRVADALASMHLPASLAPGVLAFALQDVIERVQPSYPEDWQAFGRAARELPFARLTDYVAALTADGPLLPADGGH